MLTSDILDVSKISALENATSTNGYVVVAKVDMPKDVRKCLKDEFKKDKKQCSISWDESWNDYLLLSLF